MNEKISVEPASFEPRSVGRPPRVNIDDLLYAAAENEGQWVSRVYETADAHSVMGQLKRRGYECASNVNDEYTRKVYVRFTKGTS